MTKKLTHYIEHLLSAPTLELGWWAKFLRYQVQLWRFCMGRLWANNVMAMSAALSFRTIFALVPILALSFLMLRAVGALEGSKGHLRTVLATSGLDQIIVREDAVGQDRPTAALDDSGSLTRVVNVADEIERLVGRVESKLTVERVGPIGVILLVWSAMTLIATIERSLNRIFEAPQKRSFSRRIMLYWSSITLLPLLLTSASFLGRQVIEISVRTPGGSWLLSAVGWAGPFVVAVLLIAAGYEFIPNTRVSWRSALAGALVSVPLWLLAKWGFGVYVQKLVVGGNLYGALGLVPLFLVWVNVSWTILLFGAELAHTAAHLDQLQAAELARRTVLGPLDYLAAAVSVARPFHEGRGPVAIRDLEDALHLPAESIDGLLERLRRNGVICAANGHVPEGFVLARPADRIPLLEVLEMDGPPAESPGGLRYAPEVEALVAGVRDYADRALGQLSLADVLGSRWPGPPAAGSPPLPPLPARSD